MKKILEMVRLVVQYAVIGIILLYIGVTVLIPEQTVKIFKFQPYNVVTESMEPLIMVNDVVVVKAFDMEEAQVGDIITFEADIDYNGTMEVVTHYIYSIDESGSQPIIRTHRHFENPDEVTPDTWLISSDQVLGTYSFHIKYLGFLIGFIKSIYGIAVIAANIIIFGTIKIINMRAARKEEQQEEENDTLKELEALRKELEAVKSKELQNGSQSV